MTMVEKMRKGLVSFRELYKREPQYVLVDVGTWNKLEAELLESGVLAAPVEEDSFMFDGTPILVSYAFEDEEQVRIA